jgi:hypothetical protein
MSRFLPLDASVLLRQTGVFSEHQVYHNDDLELFARRGNGYLRLMDHGATSVARVFWQDLNLSSHVWVVRVGKLVLDIAATHARNRRKAA